MIWYICLILYCIVQAAKICQDVSDASFPLSVLCARQRSVFSSSSDRHGSWQQRFFRTVSALKQISDFLISSLSSFLFTFHFDFFCVFFKWYFQIFPHSFRDAARKLFLEAGPVKLSFLQLRIQSDEPLQSFQSWTLEPAWWTMMDCSCVTGTRVTGFAHWRPLSR